MLSCPPVAALGGCWVVQGYSFFSFVTDGPTFTDRVLGRDIGAVGYLNSLPYAGRFAAALASAAAADALAARGVLSVLAVRRMAMAMVLLAPGKTINNSLHKQKKSTFKCLFTFSSDSVLHDVHNGGLEVVRRRHCDR